MTTFAFVLTANDQHHRLMAANLILSSRVYGDYPWYAVMDKPLGVGERFVEMTWGEKKLWPTENNPKKKYLKFASVERAMAMSSEDVLIHVDVDCVFHGHPSLDRIICEGYRSFSFLEGDLLDPKLDIEWKWPTHEIRQWVRAMKYPHGHFYNNHGGLFGVRRDSWFDFVALVDRAIGASVRYNLWDLYPWLSDEPPMAYAVQMQNSDRIDGLRAHRNLDIFFHSDEYPGKPTRYWNWSMTESVPVPDRIGIVHTIGKSELMVADGLRRLREIGKALL